jgi:hypothetical protein
MIWRDRPSWQFSDKAPAFFTGEAGCFCCGAPPPTSRAYYDGAYYTRRVIGTSGCTVCSDAGNRFADNWQLEVTGFVSYTPAAPCESSVGATCENNNGTFVLGTTCTPDPPGFGCCRQSPAFTSQGFIVQAFSTPDICESMSLQYRLHIYPSSGISKGATLLLMKASGAPAGAKEVYATWKTPAATTFNCLSANTLTLQTASPNQPYWDVSPGCTACCDGAPSTVTITPIP